MTADTWNPEQYDHFRDERSRPFFDLADLVQRQPEMRVLDLGCGSGRLTAWLHRRLGARETLGIDSSAAMLSQSAEQRDEAAGLRFVEADIADYQPDARFDLVFSNAALQWLPDHESLFPRVAEWVAPGGQLAVQMPANFDHPSHATAARLAAEEPFATALEGWLRTDPVLAPEAYALLLARSGLDGEGEPPSPQVRLQVYLHELERSGDVLEWVRGSLLTAYQQRMPEDLFERFLTDYESILRSTLGDRRPYLYPFKRLLFWGRRGD